METPPEPEQANTPEPDAEAEVDLNALRDAIQAGEDTSRFMRRPPSDGEPLVAPVVHDPTDGPTLDGPTLDELRRALREGRATGPMPSAEEVREAAERNQRVADTGEPGGHIPDSGSSERE